jgi:hypothetical protein
MLKITVASLAVVLAALGSTAGVGAQVPEGQTPTVTQEPVPTIPPGSISGRVIVEGPPGVGPRDIIVMPTDTPQPIPYAEFRLHTYHTDDAGYFSVTGLADDEYFLIIGTRGGGYTTNLTESVSLTGTGIDPEPFSLPALRVTITNGEAVTGIVITFVYPTPGPIIDDFGTPGPLSPVAGLPATGTAGGGGNDPATYISVAVAGLALLALIGGVAWRMRGASAG